MSKGQRFGAEWRTFTDDQTGVEVRQLTNYKGHSHHLYFTNPGWYDDGQRLLFGSDRGNRTNLYSIELANGEITQLTDLDQPPPRRNIISVCQRQSAPGRGLLLAWPRFAGARPRHLRRTPFVPRAG